MMERYTLVLLLCHVASTWYMTGLIWFVQIVHYPLFAAVPEAMFPDYEQRHTAWTTWAVGPPMLVEAGTMVLLLYLRPAGIPGWQLWLGAALLASIWLSTAMLQVPCHQALSQNFDATVHQRLVTTNWIRTVAWTARGLLVLLAIKGQVSFCATRAIIENKQ